MRVMVIGASKDRKKYGNKAVRAFMREGHTVLPVNPNETEIEGLEVYETVADVPGPIDRVTVYLPTRFGISAMKALGKRDDVGEVWLNPGADEPEVVAAAREAGYEPILACSIIAIGEMPE
ncbi:MAG: CoA-binding protein [Phycisphaerales bacterium]|nr:CoA-binding protein [Phycisphaerales bacterium]